MQDIIFVRNTTDCSNIDFQKGATILVDKPREWTSFDVVNKVRNRLRRLYDTRNFKVGHAGTLDPLATGLLVLCTGKNTKLISQFQNESKSYTATIKLGATTKSFDREHPEENIQDLDNLDPDVIVQTIETFRGPQMQLPPMFSAIKKNGVPLYKLARKGKEVEISPRVIEIYELDIESIELPLVTIKVSCSKGTYIRTLANDIGKKLGIGAYLYDLRRTSSGQLDLKEAVELDSLIENIELRIKDKE